MFRTLWLITPVRETGCQYITLRAPSPDLKLGPPHTSVCVRENVVYDLWEGSKDLWECMWVMVGPSGSWCVSVRVCVCVCKCKWVMAGSSGRSDEGGVWIYGCAKFTTLTGIQSRPLTRERERDWHPSSYTVVLCVCVCFMCHLFPDMTEWGENEKPIYFLYINLLKLLFGVHIFIYKQNHFFYLKLDVKFIWFC